MSNHRWSREVCGVLLLKEQQQWLRTLITHYVGYIFGTLAYLRCRCSSERLLWGHCQGEKHGCKGHSRGADIGLSLHIPVAVVAPHH